MAVDNAFTLADFDFELPYHLIAQWPARQRTDSRLLQVQPKVDGKGVQWDDGQFVELTQYFVAGDMLVLNNTQVIPARLYAQKVSGGHVEVFVERIQSEHLALCMIKANRAPKIGSELFFAAFDSSTRCAAKVLAREEQFYLLELLPTDTLLNWSALLEAQGEIPLPPYIDRAIQGEDLSRYQTVYAEHAGAVAAPTAGLHFDAALLEQLHHHGVEVVYLTLHVGAGTFLPVKTENLDQHVMHAECFVISPAVADKINQAKCDQRRITAVGTTSLRALESAWDRQTQALVSGEQETQIFIRPGYDFHVVDRLITNFHLPKSSLMMLVSAFAGYDTIRATYQYAIAEQYRFFSYGDAMLLGRAR